MTDRTTPTKAWSERVSALAVAITPRRRRDWIGAMAREASFEERPASSMAWSLSCLAVAARLCALEGNFVFAGCAGLAIAALVYLDWHTVKTAQVLILLFATAAAMGRWRPRASLAIGLLFGCSLFVFHAASNLTGLFRPFYQWKALQPTDWLIMAAVLPPAMAAALAGARLPREIA
jgi:hypothetical protein